MKQRFVVFSLCLLSMISGTVFAAQQRMVFTQHYKKHANATTAPAASTTPTIVSTHANPQEAQNPVTGPLLPTTGATYLPVDLDVPGQSWVSSGPYIGIPLEFSGGNLIINSPSVNQDVALLKVRKNIHKRLEALGVSEDPDHAHILLSGILEGQVIYKHKGVGPSGSDIDLTSAGLDAYVLSPSRWVSALLGFNYENDVGANTGSVSTRARVQNSRVLINQAFITVGDFTSSNWYGTIGQVYVPFGTFSSVMISSPLTKLLARTKARAIVVGYQQQTPDAFYTSGFVFKGDSHAGSTGRVNNGGLNVGYRYVAGSIRGDIGGGFIANIADSVGMQNTGNIPSFTGFGGPIPFGDEFLDHQVPAYDLRGMLGIGENINILGEYVSTINKFNPEDLMMNSHGAKPSAGNLEGSYTFNAFSFPSSIGIGFGMSKDALALGLASRRVGIVFNTSFWKDSVFSLEYRHDVNYSSGDTATGSGVLPLVVGPGRPDNLVIGQLDVYF